MHKNEYTDNTNRTWKCAVVFFIKKIIVLILIPLLTLVTVQLCLHNPHTREMFTNIEESEKIKSDFLKYNNAIAIKTKDYNELEVYFNGEKVGDFTSDVFYLDILCSGIVEIKNNSNRTIVVAVDSFCNNASVKILNTELNLGLTKLCNVVVDPY